MRPIRPVILLRTTFAAAGLWLAGYFAAPAVGAPTTELMIADHHNGVALHGFDPVAYFLDHNARIGSERIELRFGGLVWRFANEGNRAAFAAQPDVYVPNFGGYDPIALIRGVPVAGHPAIFVVQDGHLYLFERPESRKAFLSSPYLTIETARSAWPGVRRTLVP